MKKLHKINKLNERKAIWHAVSNLYLDSELDSYDYKQIAQVIYKSSFGFEEVKSIDKYEVFPVLIYNILSIAGIWGEFEKDNLSKAIIKNLEQRNAFTKLFLEIFYFIFKDFNIESWNKIQQEHLILKKINS